MNDQPDAKRRRAGLLLAIFTFTATAAAISGVSALRRDDWVQAAIALVSALLLTGSGWITFRSTRRPDA